MGIVLLVAALAILGDHFLGQGRAGRTLSSAPLPPGLGPMPSSTPDPVPRASDARAPILQPVVVPDKPGVPVTLIVDGHGVQAAVSADRLNADGSLYVPPDPRELSWASEDVGPGSSYGTAILVGHINYRGVEGVFSNLADYRVGQAIRVVLADGRRMDYAVAAPPIEVNKDEVGRRRQELFDQSSSYGLAGKPKSGRLLLLSCGGAFDNRTGHYESNIFVYALPV
ncbi:MAG: class F sortase [Dermatophilaceae bacterium]